MEITAMEILERCRRAPDDLARLKAQKQRLKECAEGMRGQDPSRVGSAGTAEQDRLAAFAADIDEVERKIKHREREKIEEERVSCLIIAYIPAIMGEVLYRYYVGCMTLDAIAQHSNYHPSYVRKLKARGDKLVKSQLQLTALNILAKWYTKNAA